MALTYQQSASLMQDQTFIARVKIACMTYATTISNEAATVPAHISRLRWAQSVFVGPDTVAASLTQNVVMDPMVQSQGATIADSDLQTVTQAAADRFM